MLISAFLYTPKSRKSRAFVAQLITQATNSQIQQDISREKKQTKSLFARQGCQECLLKELSAETIIKAVYTIRREQASKRRSFILKDALNTQSLKG
jgi:hypothetical protein